jgi:hypothetical protein
MIEDRGAGVLKAFGERNPSYTRIRLVILPGDVTSSNTEFVIQGVPLAIEQ